MWRSSEEGFAAWKYLTVSISTCNRCEEGPVKGSVHKVVLRVNAEDLGYFPLTRSEELWGRGRSGVEERDVVKAFFRRYDVEVTRRSVHRQAWR